MRNHNDTTLLPAEIDFLNTLIGPEGDYYTTIRDYPNADWGTKLLCLERSILLNQDGFESFIDTVYTPTTNRSDHTMQIEFINALITLNNLCFNNTIRFEFARDNFRIKPALDHYFGGFNNRDKTIADPKPYQKCIKTMLIDRRDELCAAHPQAQKEAEERKALSKHILPQKRWKTFLNPRLEATGTRLRLLDFSYNRAHPRNRHSLFRWNSATSGQGIDHQKTLRFCATFGLALLAGIMSNIFPLATLLIGMLGVALYIGYKIYSNMPAQPTATIPVF